MPIVALEAPVRSLLAGKNHRFGQVWTITREDQRVFRFTDHSVPIELDDGVYVPMGGVDGSARERQEGLSEGNQEIRGVISSDAILEEDLVAGRFRRAEVRIRLVDWRFPFAGTFADEAYWIESTEWDGVRWRAQMVDVARWLRANVGQLVTRNCANDLGDAFGLAVSGCKFDLASASYSPVVVATVTDERLVFRADALDVPGGLGDDWFNEGLVVWITGDNAGLRSQIRDYEDANRAITLHLKTPFPIAVADVFELQPGCNKLFGGDCLTKYSQRVNFRGSPFQPNTDDTLKTPSR